MHSIEFWSSLIISFIAFKFEDMFIAILFALVALTFFVTQFNRERSQKSKYIITKKGRVIVSLDMRTATEEDVKELTKIYMETAEVFKTLIKQRDKK